LSDLGSVPLAAPCLASGRCARLTAFSAATALSDLDHHGSAGDTSRMAHVISLRTLRTLSAAAIERLQGPVSVESDGRTVAMLVPIRPTSAESRARFQQALARAQSARTVEEQDALDRDFGP